MDASLHTVEPVRTTGRIELGAHRMRVDSGWIYWLHPPGANALCCFVPDAVPAISPQPVLSRFEPHDDRFQMHSPAFPGLPMFVGMDGSSSNLSAMPHDGSTTTDVTNAESEPGEDEKPQGSAADR